MQNTVSFYTLGCRLNQAETAILQTGFEEAGYQVVEFKNASDVVVVNTCTVTLNGDADTRKVVNKINRTNPQAKIALVGCQAQIQREKLLDLPNVKWVIGNENKLNLPFLLRHMEEEERPQVLTPLISRKSFTLPFAGIDRQHTRANLKIQDGCDFFCSFCVIPFARGRARSRYFEDILKEAKYLVTAGYKELVLTGINVGTYSNGRKNISDVLEALVKISGLERIRISSIEPTTIPAGLVDLVDRESKICRYFHLPLQSGSHNILKKMNRRYSVKEFSDFVWQLEGKIEGICLGTDVMVGFPGETDFCFLETYDLLCELPFAYFHVFSYSERPWTKSRKMDQKISREIIEERSKILRELSHQKRNTFLIGQLDSVQLVLFEQKKNGFWSGLTDTYVRVKVDSKADLRNKIRPVKLLKIDGQTIIGRI